MQFQFLEAIYFPVTTLSYSCFLLNILKIFRATVKYLQYSPCMVIDSRQKRFAMNMQVIHCLAKPFRPKKIKKQILTGIFGFQKKLSRSKKPEFQNLLLKMTNWQPCMQPATA